MKPTDAKSTTGRPFALPFAERAGAYIFTDIDLTLFQTMRYAPPDTPLSPAALDRKGEPNSFFTPQQEALLTLLGHASRVIPVTARNSEALSRVLIRFDSYKVVSHGALILDADDHPLSQWMEQNNLAGWSRRINEAFALMAQQLPDHPDLRYWIVEDHEMPVYISLKGKAGLLESLKPTLNDIWSREGAFIHHNERNMALLPPFARKELATSFLMKQIRKEQGHPLFIGMGDSLSDLPFMRDCDFAVVPRNSQIAESSFP